MENLIIIINNKNNNYEINTTPGITIRELLNMFNKYRNSNRIDLLYNKDGQSYYLDYLINKSMNFYTFLGTKQICTFLSFSLYLLSDC